MKIKIEYDLRYTNPNGGDDQVLTMTENWNEDPPIPGDVLSSAARLGWDAARRLHNIRVLHGTDLGGGIGDPTITVTE